MQAAHLDSTERERLIAAPLTYPTAGALRGGPAGYTKFARTADLGSLDFAEAANALMSWRVQLRSGNRVAASSPAAQTGSVVVPHHRRLAYGTLPGHPESGEESFILDLADDRVTITAFSLPTGRPTGWPG